MIIYKQENKLKLIDKLGSDSRLGVGMLDTQIRFLLSVISKQTWRSILYVASLVLFLGEDDDGVGLKLWSPVLK